MQYFVCHNLPPAPLRLLSRQLTIRGWSANVSESELMLVWVCTGAVPTVGSQTSTSAWVAPRRTVTESAPATRSPHITNWNAPSLFCKSRS